MDAMAKYIVIISGKFRTFTNSWQAGDKILDPDFNGERDGSKWGPVSGMARINGNEIVTITHNCNWFNGEHTTFIAEIKKTLKEVTQ